MPHRTPPAVALVLSLAASGGHAQTVPDDAPDRPLVDLALEEIARRETVGAGFYCGSAWLTFTGADVNTGDQPPSLATHTFRKSAVRSVWAGEPNGPPSQDVVGTTTISGFVSVTDVETHYLIGVSEDTHRRVVLCLD